MVCTTAAAVHTRTCSSRINRQANRKSGSSQYREKSIVVRAMSVQSSAMTRQDELKRDAANKAVESVKSGMVSLWSSLDRHFSDFSTHRRKISRILI